MEVRGGSTEVSTEIRGGPWRSVEVSMEVRGGSMDVSMEVRGGLRGGLWRLRGGLHGGLHGGPCRLHGGLNGVRWMLMESPRISTEPPWSLHGGLNYMNKKHIFSYCSSTNKEYLTHQYSFKLKWFNCLYLFFFKSFHGFYFMFVHSNLDILFKICLGRCYFIFAPTYDFAYEQKAYLFQTFCTRNPSKPIWKD